jgi:hypothetical protein
MEAKIKDELTKRGVEVVDRISKESKYKRVALGWYDEMDEWHVPYIVRQLMGAMKYRGATKVMFTVRENEVDAVIV